MYFAGLELEAGAAKTQSGLLVAWNEGAAKNAIRRMGREDIQSLADLGNSFHLVNEMRLLPVSRKIFVQLGVLMVLAIVPLPLTLMPLEQMIDGAIKIFI